jgi:hypothetical protein
MVNSYLIKNQVQFTCYVQLVNVETVVIAWVASARALERA